MRLENGKISERQGFRIGLLENIAVGMVIIPYFTITYGGDQHVLSYILGVIFTVVYGFIMYGFSKMFPEGMIEVLNTRRSLVSGFVDLIYIIRFSLKAGLIMLFFAKIIQEYMLRSFNLWYILLPFALVCAYGGARDIEKRGRLLELLFWWMIVPLITVVVFSISNFKWSSLELEFLPNSYDVGDYNIWFAGYLILIVTSTLEMMQFTFSKQKKNSTEGVLRLIIWIIVALTAAYAFIVGILGRRWVGSKTTAALNVIESASIMGGTFERMDYPVLAFWIIGVFAVISGYMFYAKEFARKLCQGFDKKPGLVSIFIAGMVVLFAYLWSLELATWFVKYILWFDIGVSLLIPLIIYIVRVKRV